MFFWERGTTDSEVEGSSPSGPAKKGDVCQKDIVENPLRIRV